MERFGRTPLSSLENLRKGSVNCHVKPYFILALCCGIFACATVAMKRTRATDQSIEKINLLAVRFFRPSYPVADLDDFSQNSRELKCTEPSGLWADLLAPEKSQALLTCLNSLKVTANYIYVPQTEPVLAVDPLQKKPDLCIYQLLPSLPLPREIYFLGQARGKTEQAVYSMSFDTKANEFADAKVRSARFETELRFPLRTKLQSSQDLHIWLTTLVLSLFRDEEKQWRASTVTENVVNQCFGDDSLFLDKRAGNIPPAFWP
jgi:hypothetical protein